MRTTLRALLPCCAAALAATAHSQSEPAARPAPAEATFAPPVRLRTSAGYVRTEEPGWAAPAWFDVDGDGRKDLVVGQFAGGKMKVYPGDGKLGLAPGKWLEAGGKVAEVPGVW